MRFNVCQLVAIAIFGLFFTACRSGDSQITASIIVQGTTIGVSQQRGLSVNVVSSADVQFEWSTTAGTLSNTSSQSAIFTAPDVSGPVTVDLKVTSGNQIATDSITLEVMRAMPTTPSPIACGDSRIAPGIFEQLRNETTPSFADSSGAVTFECEGVYDLFNTMPPAVRINYEAVADSFAFFGISIPEGFDVSGFSEICVWVYAEVLEQQFDLKLEDINVGEGVEISTTETNEWAQHCVSLLEGYPNVDLSSISVITLSFNDSFGSARVWIDDFELK